MDTSNLASVDCFPGEVATGGGIETTNGATRDMMAITSRPTLGPEDVPNGWDARAYNVDSNGDNAGTSAYAHSPSARPPDRG